MKRYILKITNLCLSLLQPYPGAIKAVQIKCMTFNLQRNFGLGCLNNLKVGEQVKHDDFSFHKGEPVSWKALK